MFLSLRGTSYHLIRWILRDAPSKLSDELLKVIKGSMVLMRGRRSESNLYVLKVKGGFLCHMDDCKSPKMVTFEDDERFGLEGEIVESSTNLTLMEVRSIIS